MLGAAAAVALLFVPLDVARLVWPAWNRRVFSWFAAFIRARERDRLTGATYSALAMLVAVWVFPPPVVAAAFLYHSIGDTAAGWVGRRWGRPIFRGKSLEGSLGFVVAGTLVAWPLVGLVPALAGAVVAAAAELALPVDDNLSVPLSGGSCLMLLARGRAL